MEVKIISCKRDETKIIDRNIKEIIDYIQLNNIQRNCKKVRSKVISVSRGDEKIF